VRGGIESESEERVNSCTLDVIAPPPVGHRSVDGSSCVCVIFIFSFSSRRLQLAVNDAHGNPNECNGGDKRADSYQSC